MIYIYIYYTIKYSPQYHIKYPWCFFLRLLGQLVWATQGHQQLHWGCFPIKMGMTWDGKHDLRLFYQHSSNIIRL